MNKILIIGSSGHARVIIDAVLAEGKQTIIGLLDRFRKVGDSVLGYSVLGQEKDIPRLLSEHGNLGIVVAVGDNFIRHSIVDFVKKSSSRVHFPKIIHPAAVVSNFSEIGDGTVVLAGAIVSVNCKVGDFCILNSGSCIEHDSLVSNYVSLAPKAVTGGECNVGEFVAIGIGAVIFHKVSIGENSVIGAGSVVTKSIGSYTVSYGCPARKIRSRKPGDTYL